jgi:hypothetical protein
MHSFIHSFVSPLLPSVDVIWVPVYFKIFATAVFVVLTSVPIITQHVIPNPEMKKLKSQCCDCCCCAPCCMGAEYTGRRKGDPKPVWSSSLWRSLVGGISVTFYLSIVQGLVSPLVCSSSGFLLIDADIVCWSGFHKTIAAGMTLSCFSSSEPCFFPLISIIPPAVCMALLLYFVPVSAAFGLFLGSDTIESNPLDIIWSQTYNVFLNTVKLLLAVIFAFFLDNVRVCLVLCLIVFIGATLLSATYNLRHKHSPCSSFILWYSRTYLFATATLLSAVCLLYTVTANISPSFTITKISEESFYRGAGSISWSTFQVHLFSSADL